MINPSDCWRILVGEVIKYWDGGDKKSGVITKISGHPNSPCIHLAGLSEGSAYTHYDDYSEFKKTTPRREGYILDASAIKSQEDWLCHDSRCLPSLLGGCQDCEYKCRRKTRKTIFYLGDEVYDPVWKKYSKVISILLVIDTSKIKNPPRTYYGWEEELIPSFSYGRHLDQFIDLIYMARQKKIELKSDCFSTRYVLSGNTRKTLWTGDELRIWKRHSYYLDQEQLNDICERCIFGLGSEKCETCETMTYRLVR